MKDKLLNFWGKTKEFFGKMNSKVRKILIGGVILAVLASVGIALYLNNTPYTPLFSDMTNEDASELIGKLSELGVSYKYEQDGTVLVPKDQEDTLRAQLVMEGYPKSGFAYGTFKDNVSLTSTNSEMETYKLYDLQDRLMSTISLIDGVKDAKVTIVPGEDSRYVLDDSNSTEATASVMVTMKDGSTPSPEVVKGIQTLVSKSIPKLSAENVAVIDSNGNDISVTEEQDQSDANKLKLEYEKEIENTIKAKVLNVLTPIYGADNVKVSVKSEADMDKKIRELINYDTGDPTKDKGIPSSESALQEIVRGDGQAAGGVAGTETNADIPIYNTITTDGTEDYLKQEGNIDYLVNQLKEQSQITAGYLKDLTISVTINSDDLGGVSRADLQTLIARAAGISADVQNEKIAIVNTAFYNPQPDIVPDVIDDNGQINMRYVIIGVTPIVLILLILTIVLLVLRKKKKKKQKAAAEAQAALLMEQAKAEALAVQQQADMEKADILNIQNERGMELKEKIRQFSEENPEISAHLLQVWLKGGNENG